MGVAKQTELGFLKNVVDSWFSMLFYTEQAGLDSFFPIINNIVIQEEECTLFYH